MTMTNEQLAEFKWFVIKQSTGVEGGYVMNPLDPGLATNHGITYATSREWTELWSKHGWDGDMKTLPVSLAYEIYDLGWWRRMRLDDVAMLSPTLASEMFDFGINAGRSNCITSLQRLINVSNRRGVLYPNISIDGGFGDKTLDGLRAYMQTNNPDAETKLTYFLSGMRVWYYVDISERRSDEKNEEFTRGWLNRCWDRAIGLFRELVGN